MCLVRNKTHICSALNFLRGNSVHKPFSVVNARGPQVLQAVRRAEDVAVEDYMIGRLLLSATDAFGCIQQCPSGTGMYHSGRRQFLVYSVLSTAIAAGKIECGNVFTSCFSSTFHI